MLLPTSQKWRRPRSPRRRKLLLGLVVVALAASVAGNIFLLASSRQEILQAAPATADLTSHLRMITTPAPPSHALSQLLSAALAASYTLIAHVSLGIDWLAKSLSGAGAGVVATVLCSPLDVAKSRMQVQSALGGSKGQQYTGVSSALLKIFRDEGVGGWYQASCHTQVAHKSHTHKSHTHKSHTHKSHTQITHTRVAHTQVSYASLTHTSLTHKSHTQVSHTSLSHKSLKHTFWLTCHTFPPFHNSRSRSRSRSRSLSLSLSLSLSFSLSLSPSLTRHVLPV